MEISIVVLVTIFIIAFFIGKRVGSSKDPEIRVTFESSGLSGYEIDDDKDGWEGGFWDATDPKKLTAYIEIDYVDANKSTTTRVVRVREFDNSLYGGIIMGHCELRNATRTFRFDRIKKCVDLDTGEEITDVRKYLNDKYDQSPEKSTDILEIDYVDVLKVIYFVAKADGQYRKEEKAVITQYVRKLVRDDRITTEMVDGILKEMDVPSMQSFKLALGRVLKGGEVNPELLATCCKEIVNTQKTVHPMEKEALEYIAKKLASMPKSNA
ncbi:MAG: hypothetical protein ABW079_06715 [Sedimenticola sp.]